MGRAVSQTSRRYSFAIKYSDGDEAIVIVQGNTRAAASKRARMHATKSFRAIVLLGPALRGDTLTPFPERAR